MNVEIQLQQAIAMLRETAREFDMAVCGHATGVGFVQRGRLHQRTVKNF